MAGSRLLEDIILKYLLISDYFYNYWDLFFALAKGSAIRRHLALNV
jgi:hypothetical protein